MNNLKSAVIGCGAIAREHLTVLSELKNVEIVAVCDLSAARAQYTAERFGVAKWYSDYKQLIAEFRPDLVHITTPPAAHFEIAKTCLDAGLNVLCEKPITVAYEDFVVLKQLATKNGCMLVENHNVRFHSSVRRIQAMIESGALGDVLEVQIVLLLNLTGADSSYADKNVPHFGLALRGGVIGDFLTHIACLTRLFVGPVVDLRTIWKKLASSSVLPSDEFRSLINGEHATASVVVSGNAQPNGFWVRVVGTKMQVETNLFESPRFTFTRMRVGEPALMSLVDGIAEARDVLGGTVAAFWRKLAGTSGYDGLSEFIARVYQSIEARGPQPISLDEIDEVARLVDSFTKPNLQL